MEQQNKNSIRHPAVTRDPCTPFWESGSCSLLIPSECMLWPRPVRSESQRLSGPSPPLWLPLTGMKAITSGWVIRLPRVTSPRSRYKSSRQPPAWEREDVRSQSLADIIRWWKCQETSSVCRVTAVQVNAGSFVMQMRMQSVCLYLWRQTVVWETHGTTAPVQRNCVCRTSWWETAV